MSRAVECASCEASYVGLVNLVSFGNYLVETAPVMQTKQIAQDSQYAR